MFDIVGVPESDLLGGFSDAELIDAARASARVENAACARKLAVMAEIFTRRTGLPAGDRESWWVDPEASVTAELAAAGRITAGLASAQAHRGVALRDRLPKVNALFLDGVISELLVRTIIWRTYLITDPAVMAAVDAELAAEISTWGAQSAAKTELAIDALVERHDPDGVRRRKHTATTPCVEFGSPIDEPGFTTIWARIYAGDAAAAEKLIDEMAHSVCPDDPRTLDDRRTQAYTALLTGFTTLACHCGSDTCQAATNPRPHRDTTIYILTDHTPDGQHRGSSATPAEENVQPDRKPPKPAYIFGAGLTPTPLLEGLCQDAKYREIVHPGASGPEPRYTPSRALAAFVRCRDLTCRFPGCDQPATLADIDHTVPYPVGPTHPSNLKCLCRFHHLLKTFWIGATGWRDRQYPDGTIVWTAPTGHTYTTYPGSRLLFPTLCQPTGTLWTGDPPETIPSDRRDEKMPRRRNTRAHNRLRTIDAERKHNREQRARERPARTQNTRPPPIEWHEPDYGDDPPPF
ncbi:HNH endonuclease signature motif containing protein [Mycobacterium sp. NAZ190054]|uniref:HNH endonuclease signature motif containing protein n=1 Tax=Mycobacterium sp. NAZ190054 TaxID=1747766 RepID=UPI0007942D25|nr:HNH endonuclease signature motif containing protein [Mycobacterium sp. NAZ190054]KWX69155.1 hypothetical protein ASJ79_14625 [Mycobacterium sp. NAZ190054]